MAAQIPRWSLAAALAVAAGCAQGAIVSLTPNLDTSIYSEIDNSNATGGLYAGVTSNSAIRRALVEFDIAVSGIPAGSTILAVSVAFTQVKIGPAGTAFFELHPLTAGWGEGTSSGSGAGGTATSGDATWNLRLFNTTTWATAGGSFGATSGTVNFGTTNTSYSFASTPGLVADVQGWLDTPGSNFGWLLRAANEFGTSARELTTGSANPVSGNGQYRIPVGNPFQGAGQVPEIYAYGFLNPYRFCFDRLNGELIVADVGQKTVEEIDRVVLGGNYGWALKEGDFLFNRTSATGTVGTVGVRSRNSSRES